MHVLFVHQNYPAQFRYIAPRLVSDFGWRCTFCTANARAPDVPGVERVVYRRTFGATRMNHACTRGFENCVGHAQAVYAAMRARPDLTPDLVVAHSGFGSSLFLPHLYDCPVVNFFEYFYRSVGQGLGYRPEDDVSELQVLRSRTNNAMILLDLDNCDRGWCPNEHQRSQFPGRFRTKIEVCPDGVDTALYAPPADARPGYAGDRRLPDGTLVPAGTRIVTYVARGFETVRGFDVFMRAAKRIYEQFPDVLFVCAGSDRVYYGNDAERLNGKPLRHYLLETGEYDLSRFHFTGFVPEQDLATILGLSDLHVYLTTPFVTSWSMLDAMSCGCVVLASDQDCTREYIAHGQNGLLCDFFDVEGMAKQAVEVLKDPAAFRVLGDAARLTIEEEYSLDVSLPRIKSMFERVVARGRPGPSVRAELLVRRGVRPAAAPSKAPGERLRQAVALPPFDGTLPYRVVPGQGACHSARSEESHVPCASDERSFAALRMTCGPAVAGDPGGKTVLFCWELGAGLGHMMQVLPLARDLAAEGHTVYIAVRDVAAATAVFGGAGVRFLQAPLYTPRVARFPRQLNFAQLLANLGFSDDFDLFGLVCAWRNLMQMVRPDLIVFDHSPMALVAARSLDLTARRALIGSGFCCPPDTFPLPAFRPQGIGPVEDARLVAVEVEVVGRINRLLANWGQPRIERLGELYSGVDDNFLTTFPELDHYASRKGAAYWGPVITGDDAGGEAPRWPDAPGKHVYAYLKPSPELPRVVEALAAARCPTVLCIDGASEGLRRRLESPTVRVEAAPLDLARVARECDLAVLNGGHGVTAEMLLAGKPMFHVPLYLEQRLTAEAVAALGAAEVAPPRSADPVGTRLDALLHDESYGAAARRFAERYAAFDPRRQREAMLARAEELIGACPAGRPAPGNADGNAATAGAR